jgi:anaerobic magnesium-protoporphyrin IX monomethyl ester cyclase
MSALKILFSHSYFYPLDQKQWDNKTPYPPLGTIWAASYMKEKGCDVSLYDTNLRDNVDDLNEILQHNKPDIFVVYDDGFNYLTKMCLTTMREMAFSMIKQAKKQGIFVVVSSSDAADHYEKYIEAGANAVVIGEGEITLNEVIENRTNITDDIKGIAYPENGEIVVTKARPVLKELDLLPSPAWDLVDMPQYKAIWKQGKQNFTLNIATTRGCPFKCNWCAKPIYGNRYNTRSPEKVVEEIAFLNQQFGASKFWMCDDIFGLKPGWVRKFKELLQAKQLKISYKIQSRADLLLQDEQIQDLAESGLSEVWIGAESGSQKILDAMDKGITVEQIETATQQLKKYGVKVCFFLQFGYIGESKEDIAKTLHMIRKNKPFDIGVSVSYPLPGTPFYDKVKSQLSSKANWVDSDELAMMFQGTFNTSYYKTLHRYVHRMFRFNQGLEAKTLRSIVLLPYQLILMTLFKIRLSLMGNTHE